MFWLTNYNISYFGLKAFNFSSFESKCQSAKLIRRQWSTVSFSMTISLKFKWLLMTTRLQLDDQVFKSGLLHLQGSDRCTKSKPIPVHVYGQTLTPVHVYGRHWHHFNQCTKLSRIIILQWRHLSKYTGQYTNGQIKKKNSFLTNYWCLTDTKSADICLRVWRVMLYFFYLSLK